jgi:hypothetical protein
MKTGDGEMDTSKLLKDATDIFQPVMESAVVLAAHYATACGRDIVLAEDLHYGLMFAARNVTGRHVGSLYPEVYEAVEDPERAEPEASGGEESRSDSSPDADTGSEEGDEDDSGSDDEDFDPDDPEGSDSDQNSWETVDDSELVWTRYEGTDEQALAMNVCADTWSEWNPTNPAEQALKNAVDKNSIFGRE